MSVEKLTDQSVSHVECNPYAQILNDVIEHIKDNDAFRLYCFLYSKSRDWKVIKSYAEKVCGTGNTKAKKCWSYLARCGLIEYRTLKDDKGKIIKHDIVVLNGTKFDKGEPFIKQKEKLSTPTGLKTTRVENHTCGKKPTTKERFITKALDSNERKKKAFVEKQKYKDENLKRHDFADSMNQMASEKRHIEQNSAHKQSRMPDNLRSLYKSLTEN